MARGKRKRLKWRRHKNCGGRRGNSYTMPPPNTLGDTRHFLVLVNKSGQREGFYDTELEWQKETRGFIFTCSIRIKRALKEAYASWQVQWCLSRLISLQITHFFALRCSLRHYLSSQQCHLCLYGVDKRLHILIITDRNQLQIFKWYFLSACLHLGAQRSDWPINTRGHLEKLMKHSSAA